MKRTVLFILGALAVSTSALAQAPAEVEKALLAAPAQLREGATVIKWKPDFTYETLKKGTNRLVCYDKSGQPKQQPFMVECTSIGNLDRAAQNMKFEAAGDKDHTRTHMTIAVPGATTQSIGLPDNNKQGGVWIMNAGTTTAHLMTPGE